MKDDIRILMVSESERIVRKKLINTLWNKFWGTWRCSRSDLLEFTIHKQVGLAVYPMVKVFAQDGHIVVQGQYPPPPKKSGIYATDIKSSSLVVGPKEFRIPYADPKLFYKIMPYVKKIIKS